MSINVLVADDSATIQKVVSITLANESVNLISSDSEGDLLDKIKEGNIQAVLLDFGLSQEKSGFDLIKMIKAIDSNVKVLAMLPAFEQVDENRLADVGAFDSIAKPFESSKFIATFREMITAIDEEGALDDSSVNDLINSQTSDSGIGESESDFEDDNFEEDKFNPDEWISNSSFEDHSHITSADPFSDAVDTEDLIDGGHEDTGEIDMDNQMQDEVNELSETISDWGIELPSPINNRHAAGPSFPPIIDGDPIRHDPELACLNTNDANESKEDLVIDDEDDSFMQSNESGSLFSDESDSEEEDDWSMPNQSYEDKSTTPIILEDDEEEDEEFPEETSIDDEFPSLSTNDDDFSFDMNESDTTDESDENEYEEEEEIEEMDEADSLYPRDADLEYPEIRLDSDGVSELDDPIQFDDPSAVSASKRRPHFVNFENLELDKSKSSHSVFARDSEELEKEVQSDLDPSNFWDEDASSNNSSGSFTQTATPSNVDVEKFFNDIKIELLERVDRIVREVCEEKIEKVAWEVIPEIAENLIKKELKNLEQDEEFR